MESGGGELFLPTSHFPLPTSREEFIKLGFINPFLLFGILAAAVPLLIHLLSRRQAKTIDFSSLMFLLEAHRRSVRRIQLKNLLILLLRMLIITFIALALARPLLKNSFSFAGARMKTSGVIILDNSYSMDYTGISGRRFDLAKEKALEVLDSFRPGDNATLILMSDIVDIIFRRLTGDLQQVKDAIKDAKISQRTTQVSPALQAALAILAKSDNPNKEIYLITDLCRNGWKNWQRETKDSDARIFIINVGQSKSESQSFKTRGSQSQPETDNVAIEEVRFTNQLIGVNIPLELEAQIHNFSDTPLKDLTLTLFIDGKKRREISVAVLENDCTVQPFTSRFDLPGTHIGRLKIDNDRLTIDDTRYFAINVSGQIKALTVGQQMLYLTLALNPAISLSPTLDYPIIPTISSAKKLAQIPLDEYDVVVIADVPVGEINVENAEAIKQKLNNFVRNGKSVLLFGNENIDKSFYNNNNFMPAKFGEINGFQNPLKLAQYDQQHPIFRVFTAENLSAANAPNFYKAFALELLGDSKVIATFDDGTPAIVERKVGLGKVILFNTSVSDLSWSNLPLNPNFVPLLQQTIFYLTSQSRIEDKNILVGDVYSESLKGKGSREAKIQTLDSNAISTSLYSKIPNNGSRKVNVPFTVVADGNGDVKFNNTETAGIYQIEIQASDKIHRDFFAVNVDTKESDLSILSEEEVLRKLGNRAIFIKKDKQFAKRIDSFRTGKEIWSELLIVAVILMLVEVVLSNQKESPKL